MSDRVWKRDRSKDRMRPVYGVSLGSTTQIDVIEFGQWHPQAESDARDAVVEAARAWRTARRSIASAHALEAALDRLAETERGDG